MNPLFLTLEEVLAIHEDRISKYGGTFGVRELGLLQSAIGTVHLNNVTIKMSQDQLYDLVIGVAAGTVNKAQVAVFFQRAAGF